MSIRLSVLAIDLITLAILQDSLLPKLMRGEVGVKDMENNLRVGEEYGR